MTAYTIFTRDDHELQGLDFDLNDNYNDWHASLIKPASIMRLFHSAAVQHIVMGNRNAHMMWNILETNRHTTES